MSTSPGQPAEVLVRLIPSGLKGPCLNYFEVFAQSVAIIAPSTVPAALLGLIYASAGNATWLSFLLGTIGLVLVALNINQFARRSSSAGSLYSYIVKGLGPIAGVLGGWALLFAYTFTGMSTLCGFVVTGNGLLEAGGIKVPALLLYAAAIFLASLLAWRDIKLSAKSMLAFEGVAVIAVLALGFLIWRNTSFAIDWQQVTLSGASPGNVLMGIVLVVFGFSGFESSTSLGEEAKDPLRAIPRSVVHSLVLSSLLFIFMAYVVVLYFSQTGGDLAKTESPLLLISEQLGVPSLGVLINIGILLSFFACTLASMSATARLLYSMARHGLAPGALGMTHQRNKTPHLAVALVATLVLVIGFAPTRFGVSDFDSQGYFGTLSTFGFLVVYFLISLAAPAYLHRLGELSATAVVTSVLACGFMILPFIGVIGIPGSTLFPPPEYPNGLLIWIFVIYMVVGGGWLLTLAHLRPKAIENLFDANADQPVSPSRQ